MVRSTASTFCRAATMRPLTLTYTPKDSKPLARLPTFFQMLGLSLKQKLVRSASLVRKPPSTLPYNSERMSTTISRATSVRSSHRDLNLAGHRLLIWGSSSKNSYRTPTTCSRRPWSHSIKCSSRMKPSRGRRCRESSLRMRQAR